MRINDVHDRAVAFVAHNEEVRIQGLALPSLHVWHAERPGFAILIAKPGNEIIPGEFFGQPARGGDDPVSAQGADGRRDGVDRADARVQTATAGLAHGHADDRQGSVSERVRRDRCAELILLI